MRIKLCSKFFELSYTIPLISGLKVLDFNGTTPSFAANSLVGQQTLQNARMHTYYKYRYQKFAEASERLHSGKSCAFDQLEEGCPMIRLCGQLGKWTTHKCPDKGFCTILDSAVNVPSDYSEKG